MTKDKILNDFKSNLLKIAAKNKISRKKILKSLEKSKSDYSKTKSELDKISKELEKIQKLHNSLLDECSSHKKEMIRLHKIVQKMDLSGASDAVFYKDQNDVSYVIDGKEYDISLSDDGEMEKMPWRAARRARKEELTSDEGEVSFLADDDAEPSDDSKEDTFNFNLSEEYQDLDREIDDLYQKLTK